jgi:hypothetical protein
MKHRQTESSAVEPHIPVPGYWYINTSGKLIRVRLIGYVGLKACTVIIQYIDGLIRTIDIDDWHGLDILMPCSDHEALLCESDG